MQRLLIAHASEAFASALIDALEANFEIRTCTDGFEAIALLNTFQPDAAIIDLMLPRKDGLTLLQEADFIPSAILAVTSYSTAYIERTAIDAGVDYILMIPSIKTVVSRLKDLLHGVTRPPSERNAQNLAALHMQKLGFQTNWDGYQQLRIGIPMYALDPQQQMTKELYPAIANILGWDDGRKVEHSIRTAIKTAWMRRNEQVWAEYFPLKKDEKISCPTNKQFISRIAEMLES